MGLVDTLVGGAGDDLLSIQRRGHELYGGSGNDTLFGNDSNPAATGTNIFYGGDGNDNLQAGGMTIAEGGAGNDLFTVSTLQTQGSRMVVTDFVRCEDTIGVRNLVGGTQGSAIDLSGEGPATGYDGPVISWQQNGTDVEVYFDEEGDGYANATIVLENTTGLQLIDFGIIPT